MIRPFGGPGFAESYRERMRLLGRRDLTAADWDARAAEMTRTAFDGSYVSAFLSHMDLDGCATLLDVGCGPGTIGLSVAPRLAHVYGLDHSPGMLAAFGENARVRGLHNVTPIRLAWEDDWSGVPACDVVVASRSAVVPDLEAAVVKLHSKARVRAYLSYPADGSTFPLSVLRAIGREARRPPDHRCVLGILHDLGLSPGLVLLPAKNRLAGCTTFEAVHAKLGSALGALTEDESARLRRHYDAHHGRIGVDPAYWALFSWEIRE